MCVCVFFLKFNALNPPKSSVLLGHSQVFHGHFHLSNDTYQAHHFIPRYLPILLPSYSHQWLMITDLPTTNSYSWSHCALLKSLGQVGLKSTWDSIHIVLSATGLHLHRRKCIFSNSNKTPLWIMAATLALSQRLKSCHSFIFAIHRFITAHLINHHYHIFICPERNGSFYTKE